MKVPAVQQKLQALWKLITHAWPLVAMAIGLGVLLLYLYREPLLGEAAKLYDLLTERKRFADYVASYGTAAPMAFMGIQVLQVILAPIPGEFTGFVGGFLFGAYKGCFYSSLALTLGSLINFGVGRFLGKRWVRKYIPVHRFDRYDFLMRHQGVLVAFILFLIPGFPKDYLCILLGISTMPVRVFILMAAIGRVPGTLMLSLQGALVFEENYLIFCMVVGINLLVVYGAYRSREALYHWIEKINKQSAATIDGKKK